MPVYVLADIPGTRSEIRPLLMAGATSTAGSRGDGADHKGRSHVTWSLEAARILAAPGVLPSAQAPRILAGAARNSGFRMARTTSRGTWLIDRLPATIPSKSDLPGLHLLAAPRFPAQTVPRLRRSGRALQPRSGSGKRRGIYAEGNLKAVTGLRYSLAPLARMGAGMVVAEPTGAHRLCVSEPPRAVDLSTHSRPVGLRDTRDDTDLDTGDHLANRAT